MTGSKTAMSAMRSIFPRSICHVPGWLPHRRGQQQCAEHAGSISTDLAAAGLNIIDMLNKSRGEIAVTLIDVDSPPSEDSMQRITGISGVLSVRCLGCD